MLICFNLVQVSPGGGLVVREAFPVQGLVSKMKLFLHGLGQVGS